MYQEKYISVGNGHHVGVLFVIPLVFNLPGHKSEVYTLVPVIHDNVDMMMGVKYVYEIGVISTRDSYLHFLNRSTSFFPRMDILLNTREQGLLKINMPFIDDISGLVMIKLLDLKTSCNNMIKVKFLMLPKIHQNHLLLVSTWN